MKCNECRNQFSAYFESSLPRSLSDRVEGHIGSCASCREEWKDFQSLMTTLEELAPVHAPEGLEADVLRRLRHLAGAGSGERWAKARVFKYCLGSALCTFLVCLAVLWPFSRAGTGDFSTLDESQVQRLRTDGFLMFPDQGKAGENYVLIKLNEQSTPFDYSTMPRQEKNSLYNKLGINDSIYLGGDEGMEIYYLPEFRYGERLKPRSNGHPELIPVASKIAF